MWLRWGSSRRGITTSCAGSPEMRCDAVACNVLYIMRRNNLWFTAVALKVLSNPELCDIYTRNSKLDISPYEVDQNATANFGRALPPNLLPRRSIRAPQLLCIT